MPPNANGTAARQTASVGGADQSAGKTTHRQERQMAKQTKQTTKSAEIPPPVDDTNQNLPATQEPNPFADLGDGFNDVTAASATA
jgi:hypothetical protein